MKEMLKELVRIGGFGPPTRAQKFGYAMGGLLVLSGVFHVGVFLVDGGAWEGPLS